MALKSHALSVTGFDPEDLAVDVGYWFKDSTNRKGYLSEFCEFHGSEYMEKLQHISIRWLSLERCLTRLLQQYEPLTSYFKSLNEKQPRFRRPVDAFSNPLTEVYLLFYQATLPAFSTLNLLLQREKSSIFLLHEEMTKFIRKLCAKFLKLAALQNQGVHEIQYKDHSNQLFPELLPFHGPQEHDQLREEFLDYQLMDIPMPQDPATFDTEAFWGNMSSLKNRVTGLSRFGRLSEIAKLECFHTPMQMRRECSPWWD
ncbi:uncharacterized protein LOC133449178 [Cololabis saira]|uniref:uncharacterized protein LOC133449178 n=1 Tax=Cololabis saira TaxID=129043 RepID=UPI002AD558E0|nr:uncharacterized protein LOC133449178 [Cololabis saira]